MLACLNQSPTIRVGGCAGGRDNSVAGVVACLLARGQFAGVALSVSSRRAWRRAGRIRFWFRHGDLSPCLFRCLVSVAWLIPLAACFDELTFVSPVCFLSLLVSSHRLVFASRRPVSFSLFIVSSFVLSYRLAIASRLSTPLFPSVPSSYSSPIISPVHLSPSLPFPIALILLHRRIAFSSPAALFISPHHH